MTGNLLYRYFSFVPRDGIAKLLVFKACVLRWETMQAKFLYFIKMFLLWRLVLLKLLVERGCPSGHVPYMKMKTEPYINPSMARSDSCYLYFRR